MVKKMKMWERIYSRFWGVFFGWFGDGFVMGLALFGGVGVVEMGYEGFCTML